MADQHAKPVEDASGEATAETQAAAPAPPAGDGQELSDEQLAKVAGGRGENHNKNVIQSMRG